MRVGQPFGPPMRRSATGTSARGESSVAPRYAAAVVAEFGSTTAAIGLAAVIFSEYSPLPRQAGPAMAHGHAEPTTNRGSKACEPPGGIARSTKACGAMAAPRDEKTSCASAGVVPRFWTTIGENESPGGAA